MCEFSVCRRNKDGVQANCKQCGKDYRTANKEKKRLYDIKNKDPVKKATYDKAYYRKNKDKIRSYQKKYLSENRDRILVYKRLYYNSNKTECLRISKHYQQNNKDVINFIGAKRRAAKLNATPNWLTQEHLNDIKQIYQDVQDIQWLSEEKFEVDHIIPLQGKSVCGLHVPWNLQILTKSENCIKGNKF